MDVLSAVENYLRHRRFSKERGVYKVTDKGPDLVMKSPGGAVLSVEGKGQTSSQRHTHRYGKEFTKSQKEDHLGRALVKATRFVSYEESQEECGRFAIALPGDPVNLELIYERSWALERLDVGVFSVSPHDRGVKLLVGVLPY